MYQHLPIHCRQVAAAIIVQSLISAPAIAQVGSAQQDYYTVEIIVFRHAGGDDPAYRWPGQPDTKLAIDLFHPDRANGLMPDWFNNDVPRQAVYGDAAANLDVLHNRTVPGPAMVEIKRPQPVPLTADELLLTQTWRRLERSRAYQPLLHLGWRQTAAPFEDAIQVRIHGGAIIGEGPSRSPFLPYSSENAFDNDSSQVEEIDGSIAFERGRYLHLQIDLALHVPLDERLIKTQPTTPLLNQTDAIAFDEPYRTYRLVEKRQIRAGTLNYFDHRRFGVITLVEKWQPVEEEPGLEPPALLEDGS